MSERQNTLDDHRQYLGFPQLLLECQQLLVVAQTAVLAPNLRTQELKLFPKLANELGARVLKQADLMCYDPCISRASLTMAWLTMFLARLA